MRKNTGNRRFFEYKGARTGVALQAASYLCALGGFFLMAVASAHDSLLLAFAALVPFFSSPFIFRLSRRLRTRIIVDLQAMYDYLDSRDRRLVLFLREFAADLAANHSFVGDAITEWTVTDEERVVSALRGFGAVVAIGRPGERLPPGGGYRLYVDDRDWKTQVRELIERADCIVVRCGKTDGLRWEIAQIADTAKIGSTIFVSSDSARNAAVYGDLRQLLPSVGTQEGEDRQALERLRKVVEENRANLESKGFTSMDEFLENAEQSVRSLEGTRAALASLDVALASVFVVVGDRVERFAGEWGQSIPAAMKVVRQEQTSRGLLDPETPWEFESVITRINVAVLLLSLLLPAVVFLLHPLFLQLGFDGAAAFIENYFIHFLFGYIALFFFAFVLRP